MKKTPRMGQLRPKLPPVPRRVPKPRRTFALATEVAKAGGVTQVTLRDWVRRGILPPAIESLRGRGNITKYPRSAVQRAELTRRLRDDGWSLDAIAEYIRTKWTDSEKPEEQQP